MTSEKKKKKKTPENVSLSQFFQVYYEAGKIYLCVIYLNQFMCLLGCVHAIVCISKQRLFFGKVKSTSSVLPTLREILFSINQFPKIFRSQLS